MDKDITEMYDNLMEAYIRIAREYASLMNVIKYAIADLEGVMPAYEPSGDGEHSGWQIINDIKRTLWNKGA